MRRSASDALQDLAGAAQLATDATLRLTDLVEAVHAQVVRPPRWGHRAHAERTGALSGWVYRSVRVVTRVTGHSMAALLQGLSRYPQAGASGAASQRASSLAALNGVLGDYLADTRNPLATAMSLQGAEAVKQPEAVAEDAFAHETHDTSGRLLLMIHGLCMNEQHWTRAGHNHGLALGQSLRFEPLFLRYNSGLHIATNGQALAELLERTLAQAPRKPKRLVIIGHSMGGLLARSAIHHGRQAGHRWPQQVTDLICLGTPHHGAPLERIGHGFNTLLERLPYLAPFARLGRLRSAGMTDLRYGSLLNVNPSRFLQHSDPPEAVALPDGIRCFALAATLGQRPSDRSRQLLGDGLVPLDSALGRHPEPSRHLAFLPHRQWVAEGAGHFDLLNDPRVYARLLQWLSPASRRRRLRSPKQ
jgi:pimeloyl-ACP methyl ester carboxylesterase